MEECIVTLATASLLDLGAREGWSICILLLWTLAHVVAWSVNHVILLSEIPHAGARCFFQAAPSQRHTPGRQLYRLYISSQAFRPLANLQSRREDISTKGWGASQ